MAWKGRQYQPCGRTKQKAQHAIAYLMEKRDSTVKERTAFNSKPMQEWLGKEDSTNPTSGLESIILNAVIDAEEEQDMMTLDVLNTFYSDTNAS